MDAAPAVAVSRVLSLNRPESFIASLRSPGLQAGEFRLHHRRLLASDQLAVLAPACVIGFVLPKRLCKAAVRRNLIRRVFRAELRDWLAAVPNWPDPAPVLVFKQTQKLPAEFTSAKSAALRLLLRQRAAELLAQYQRRQLQAPA